MNKELQSLMDKLNEAVASDDFIGIAYEVTDELENKPYAFESIQPILELMEKNPGVDFGSPGPLVHFIEKLDYVDLLLESLRRRPTPHTVWMLNRIINACKGENKQAMFEHLMNVLNYPNLDEDTLASAKDFISFQLEQ